MTIATVIDGIQAVNAGITGVTAAPVLASYPSSLHTAQMPLALTYVGPGQPTQMTGSWTYHIRQYIIRVYVKPVAQGLTWTEGYEEGVTLLQAFVREYTYSDALGSVADHIGVNPGEATAEDTGLIPLTQGGDPEWWGFEIRVWVKEQITT